MGKDWYWGSAGTSSGKKQTSYGKGRRRRRNPSGSGGCITAVFQLFRSTHFNSPYAAPAHQIHSLKGIEAPRNSLELEIQEIKTDSCGDNDDDQRKRSRSRSVSFDLSSSQSQSQSQSQVTISRSPSLVARLMGVDLFPDHSSIRPGTRSLPETPRVSSSIDTTTHRMSLQENKSPRQIVKQTSTSSSTSTSAGKRVYLKDITNTNTTSVSRNRQKRRDQELLTIKSKKSNTSPLETKKQHVAKSLHPRTVSPLQRKQTKKCDKKERFRSRLDKPPQTSDITRKRKQEQQQFLRPADQKKTTFLSTAVKKYPSPSATGISSLQNQKPSKESRTGGAEYRYVTMILKHMGIEKDTTLSSAMPTWFSPSHPVAPSIFHQLEPSHHHYTDTATRKLMFHLVDQLLVQMLSPYTNMKSWSTCTNHHFRHVKFGSELVDTLCSKIRSFPARVCRTAEDIDAIIDGDSPDWKLRDIPRLAVEEEGERLVRDIEKHVMDTLLHETAFMVLSFCRFETNN